MIGPELVSGLAEDLEPFALGLVYVVAGLTVISGLDYTVRTNRMVGERARHEAAAASSPSDPAA